MTEQTQENVLDRKDLKILAYKEKVAELQEREADLRVEVTFLSQQLQEAHRRLAELEVPAEDGEVEPDVQAEES